MLSVRVTLPASLRAPIERDLRSDPAVADLAVIPGAALDGAGDLLVFDVAREGANGVMRMLRKAGVPREGSVVVSEPVAMLSDAADLAERVTPGHPADGVVWAQLADRSREDSRPSWSFLTFLLLATLIAGIGRLLDQPILIIGAMVVGPEFAPIAAISYAVVRARRGIAGAASLTLFGGFAVCGLVAWGVWAIVYATGAFSFAQATTGPQTQFIVSPDGWSFVIAILAGIAGVLSLTSSKSSALVGVFISITTVPAVGTLSLTLAVGAWEEAGASLVQLVLNLAGLLIAGTATLFVQLRVGRWVSDRVRERRAVG
ncbi:hypothetical protein CVS47_00077 [Microbacterium lemovicicum]|uniref:DUF389 domain-containing protein n=1 Tax=Microbacterium lemovicicum TaxID=1072463 RepID=A0A3S9W627_9MICO|nr:DUF389 domain-containing protein [Microbacterium lemovicicum]AZS35485.1 hypothetical protein CVS47_00077 [Microbacterium lemovicicum]